MEDGIEGAEPSCPPIGVVVVTRDPGPWFVDCLAAIARQDHDHVAVLVVDNGSADQVGVARLVATHLPEAVVHRCSHDSYGRAVNEGQALVEGAVHLLLLHDDVAPAPDVARMLQAAAIGTNSAIVGPKLVDWDEPRRLLAVGVTTDRTGVPAPLVDPGELDQGQHDGVREVGAVPGGAVLVRTDLFRDLGGFDPGITFLGDDVDLCARVRAAGGRISVDPDSVVRHREALALRRPVSERRRLAARHRLRSMLVATPLRLLPVAIAMAGLFALVEIAAALVGGRASPAADVAGAWPWNLARRREILRRRRDLRPLRSAEVRFWDRTIAGSARITMYMRGQIGSEQRARSMAERGRNLAGGLGGRAGAVTVGVVVAFVALLVVGSRHLFGDVAPVGTLPAGASLADLWREWTDPWRGSGLGSSAPAAPGLAVSMLISVAGGGVADRWVAAALALPVVVLLAGVWRLSRPAAGVPGAAAALVVAVVHPATRDALSGGDWSALVAIAVAPWLLVGLGAAAGWWSDPTQPSADPYRPRLRWPPAVRLGAGLAVAAAVAPAVVVLPPLIVVGGLVGGLASPLRTRVADLLSTASGAMVVAALLLAPWSVALVMPEAQWAAFGGSGVEETDVLDVLRGSDTGGPMSWAVAVLALIALLVGRGTRLDGALRAWGVIGVTGLGAWAVGQGWTPLPLPVSVIAAPVVAATALAAALAVAGGLVDLQGVRLGIRHLGALAGLVATAAVAVSFLASLDDGRWDLPRRGQVASVAALADEASRSLGERTVWIGADEVLPVSGWRLVDGVAVATVTDRSPDVRDRWTPPDPADARRLVDVLRLAVEGRTTQLGRLLAPMGVRNVVLVRRAAPVSFDLPDHDLPPELVAGLDRQVDLATVAGDGTIDVYRNAAWKGRYPLMRSVPGRIEKLDDARSLPPRTLARGLTRDEDDGPYGAELPAGTNVLVTDPDDGLCLRTAGSCAPDTPAFEVARLHRTRNGGRAVLDQRRDLVSRLALVAVPLVIWAAAAVALTRARRVEVGR